MPAADTNLSLPGLGVTLVMCGSFHRNAEQLHEDFAQFGDLGCQVLSPLSVQWVSEKDGFVFAEHEQHRRPADIEADHLAAIAAADFVWMHLPDGYLGLSAAVELGFAHARAVPVFARRDVTEPGLQGLVKLAAGPEAALAALNRPPALPAPPG